MFYFCLKCRFFCYFWFHFIFFSFRHFEKTTFTSPPSPEGGDFNSVVGDFTSGWDFFTSSIENWLLNCIPQFKLRTYAPEMTPNHCFICAAVDYFPKMYLFSPPKSRIWGAGNKILSQNMYVHFSHPLKWNPPEGGGGGRFTTSCGNTSTFTCLSVFLRENLSAWNPGHPQFNENTWAP